MYCPAVYLNGNIIDYVGKTKYLGYMFTNDKQDDVERLRQLRLMYMRHYAIKPNNTHVSFLYVVLLLLSMDRVQKINF